MSHTDFLLVCCLLPYIVGCALAFGSEDQVLRQLPSINALFLAGSACLLLDVILTVAIDKKVPSFIDMVAAVAFVYAACLGGYGETVEVVRAGMFGWLVGSSVGLILPSSLVFCGKSSLGCCCGCKKHKIGVTTTDESSVTTTDESSVTTTDGSSVTTNDESSVTNDEYPMEEV